MFRILVIVHLISATGLMAQQEDQIFQTGPELRFTDSLLISASLTDREIALDNSTAKRAFERIYTLREEVGKVVKFFLAGKITSLEHFNLVLLRTESSTSSYVYLVTLQKDGKQIEYMEVASDAESKQMKRAITSTLYNDLRLIAAYNIATNLHRFQGTFEQRITPEGKFVNQQLYGTIPRE